MYKDPMSQADMAYKRYKALNPVEEDDRRSAGQITTDDSTQNSTENYPRGVASAKPIPKDRDR